MMMPTIDYFTGRPSAPTVRKPGGLLGLSQARPHSPPAGSEPQSKPTPEPRTHPHLSIADRPTEEDRQFVEFMRRSGRVFYAPGSEQHQTPAGLSNSRNWFMSPDGQRLVFDPGYRLGHRQTPGALTKDPYRLGDVAPYYESRAPWLQDQDQRIIRETMLFNMRHGYQPTDQGYLDPSFVKSLFMAEAGGMGHEQAYRRDPAQIYNVGDWGAVGSPTSAERTRYMGVPDPRSIDPRTGQPSEITPRQDIRAGLEWFYHKRRMQDAQRRMTGLRDLWTTARDYNGSGHKIRYANDVTKGYDRVTK